MLGVLGCIVATLTLQASPRTWTDTRGRTTSAEFIRVYQGDVRALTRKPDPESAVLQPQPAGPTICPSTVGSQETGAPIARPKMHGVGADVACTVVTIATAHARGTGTVGLGGLPARGFLRPALVEPQPKALAARPNFPFVAAASAMLPRPARPNDHDLDG